MPHRAEHLLHIISLQISHLTNEKGSKVFVIFFLQMLHSQFSNGSGVFVIFLLQVTHKGSQFEYCNTLFSHNLHAIKEH